MLGVAKKDFWLIWFELMWLNIGGRDYFKLVPVVLVGNPVFLLMGLLDGENIFLFFF